MHLQYTHNPNIIFAIKRHGQQIVDKQHFSQELISLRGSILLLLDIYEYYIFYNFQLSFFPYIISASPSIYFISSINLNTLPSLV